MGKEVEQYVRKDQLSGSGHLKVTCVAYNMDLCKKCVRAVTDAHDMMDKL